MPKNPNFTFEVRIRISEAFTLDSIVRSPRTFKPKDVQSACQNNDIVAKSSDSPASVVAFATYVMTDFFALMHATGLYNRQRQLWESLSKVTQIQVSQRMTGIFRRRRLPIYDFAFRDYKAKTLVVGCLIDGLVEKNKPLDIVKQFIGRARGQSGAVGILACLMGPVPKDVVSYVRELTKTENPVSYYEAVLPGTMAALDLVEMVRPVARPAIEEQDSQEPANVFRLLHPELKKTKVKPAPRGSKSKSAQSVESKGLEG
jgi:hypothetical protein